MAMKSPFAVAIAIVPLLFTLMCSGQQSRPASEMPTGDAFLKKVAEINMAEIKLGNMAEQKGHSQAVKDFGRRMIQDHTKAEAELRNTAKQQRITLPSQPSEQAENFASELSKKSGNQFDKLYIEHMLKGHKGAIAIFENEIEHGKNATAKSYAEEILPAIQDHIRIAENVAGKMDLAGQQGLHQPDKAIMASASPE